MKTATLIEAESYFANVIAAEEAARLKYEAETIVTTAGLTIRELRARFDSVVDSRNWKNPIEKFLGPVDVDERKNITDAIYFFSGGPVEWVSTYAFPQMFWTVKAAGYYAAVGA